MHSTKWIDHALTTAALSLGVLAAWTALAQSPGNFSTLSTTGTATLNGDVLMCSGHPWIDVRCNGALGDGSHDDTAAIQTTIDTAILNNWPVHVPAGIYKVTAQLTIDYAGQASKGFRLISGGATLDGRTIGSGPVVQVECSGGIIASPIGCFYFKQEGTLFIYGDSAATNLATLTAGYSAGATVLGVSTTAPFYADGTINIALQNGGSFASPVSAIDSGAGTITLANGLPSAADLNAWVSRPSYPFALGRIDFSDAHNSARIDHLVVSNDSSAPGAGGCQFNYVLDSDLWVVCNSAGGAGGVALEQTVFSMLRGAGTAAGTGGSSLLIENGYNYSNTISAFDMEVSPTCLTITTTRDGENTFTSPYFACTTAVNATGSTKNLLVNPLFAGNVVNFGPQSAGIRIAGAGNRAQWQFPAAASFTAAPIDEGLTISSFNAPGASLSVTLPAVAGLSAGWSMAFTSDNGKGLTIAPQDTGIYLLAGGKTFSSLALGAGNYEYVRVEFDGSQFRLTSATRNTETSNGIVSRDSPGNWLYPSSSGYAATLADNGTVLSSFNTTGGLTVTLPTLPNPSALPAGWSMGFTAENGKPVTVQVNSVDGGQILYPKLLTASVSAVTLAGNNYEFLMLQYDGGGNFRIEQASPATAQALNLAGIGGISRWSFPATNAYAATVADNGNAIVSSNSPSAYMAVTLPSTTALNAGWTIAVMQDNSKTMAVQTNSVAGGHILYPGSGGSATALNLAAGNYELAILQYDGADNFRVVMMTPASATKAAVPGMAGISRWSFPALDTYTASTTDNGTAISPFNTPGAGVTVTLPAVSTIANGWTIAVATDNGKTMTVQVNGGAGEKILVPGTLGATTSLDLSTNTSGYELVTLQFDGSNFRIVYATPLTANVNGMTMLIGTPASSSAACQTGAVETDGVYLYLCTAPNTWKRSAWSSF